MAGARSPEGVLSTCLARLRTIDPDWESRVRSLRQIAVSFARSA